MTYVRVQKQQAAIHRLILRPLLFLDVSEFEGLNHVHNFYKLMDSEKDTTIGYVMVVEMKLHTRRCTEKFCRC